MNNFLLMLGALLVGILAALAAVPMIIDWNSYRGVFEEEASRLMGRDVRVGGGVNLRILPVPYVRFEKLRIADTASTGGDPLFRADSVTMQLSIAPLLRGVLEARSVELKRPSLRLAVDADGQGNWRSLALKPGALPFVPADVALQSVGIEGGTLLLAGPTSKDIAELNEIAGELSADSFEGPFKFKGTANWYGDQREIRLATSKPEPDGVSHLRINVRAPASLNTYAFDGRVLDLKGRPRIDGDLTAKLRLAAAAGATNSKAGNDPSSFDLKAKFAGDLKGGELTEIALSQDDTADPQLVTGSAKANWGDAVRFNMALASRSFNLDKLTPNTSSSSPLETARGALNAILSALPGDAETDASLKADRVTLGGEPVSGVVVTVNRRGTTLDIRTLKAILPGNTRLQASGTLTRDAGQTGFAGPVSLRGTNLARFLSWSRKTSIANVATAGKPAPSDTAGAVRYDGPFATEGQLDISAGRIELTHAMAEITGQSVAGELRIATEGRRKIGVTLEGDRIDAAQIWPGGFDDTRLREILTGAAPAATPGDRPALARTAAGLYGFDPDTTDLNVEVRAGELQLTPLTNLHNVDTSFAVVNGELKLQRLQFATGTGLSVELDGELSGLGQPQPKSILPAAPVPSSNRRGAMRWVINAATPQALSDLVNAIDWPTGNRPSEATVATLAALGPMRLAGASMLGVRGPKALDVTVDGSIDGRRVTGRAQLDAGLEAWVTAPLALTATIESSDVDRWLALAGLNPRGDGRATSGPRPGTVVLKAEGQPRPGLTVLASVSSERLSLVYQGLAALPKDSELTLDGTAAIAARDATEAIALAGLSLGQGSVTLPFTGNVSLSLSAGTLNMAANGSKLGSSNISGKASLRTAAASAVPGKPPVRELSAVIAMDQMTLPGLLSSISDRRQVGDDRVRWPDQPLKLADTLSGRIDLTAGQFGIDGAITLKNAAAEIVLSPGSAIVENFTAAGLGGAVSARFALKSAANGTGLTGDWSLIDANLSALTPGASAPLKVSAKMTGQGLSASGLIASLAGSGEATVGPGQIKGFAPAAVSSTIDAALASKEPLAGDDLAKALRQSLASSSLAIVPLKLPFAISEGVAKLPRTVFAANEGRATLEGTIDLSLLRYTAGWRLEATAKPSPNGKIKPPLPAVELSYGDALPVVATEGKLSLGTFEQELVVRKTEHDLEELERLRKLDEERRLKDEEERRKAAEAAAAAGAAAAAPAPVEAALPPATGAPAVPPVQSGTPASNASGQPAPEGNAAAPVAPQDTAQGPPPAPAPANASGLTRHAPQTNGAASRRRTQEGIPQPFSNNF